MNHRGTELTEAIIGAAIEVHRHPGPGLLESIYEAALAYELTGLGLTVERQKPIPLVHQSLKFEESFRIDLLVADEIVVELRCVEAILPIHEAQVISYLKLTGLKTGLRLNFKSRVLKEGIRRYVS